MLLVGEHIQIFFTSKQFNIESYPNESSLQSKRRDLPLCLSKKRTLSESTIHEKNWHCPSYGLKDNANSGQTMMETKK